MFEQGTAPVGERQLAKQAARLLSRVVSETRQESAMVPGLGLAFAAWRWVVRDLAVAPTSGCDFAERNQSSVEGAERQLANTAPAYFAASGLTAPSATLAPSPSIAPFPSPFGGSNALWNLLSAVCRITAGKSDRVPPPALVHDRRGALAGGWHRLKAACHESFEPEYRPSLAIAGSERRSGLAVNRLLTIS